MNHGHMHTATGQQVIDGDERSAIFLWRRCIHDHETVPCALPAEIAAKARIAAGRRQAAGRHRAPGLAQEKVLELLVEPRGQLLQAYIVFRHYKGLRRP